MLLVSFTRIIRRRDDHLCPSLIGVGNVPSNETCWNGSLLLSRTGNVFFPLLPVWASYIVKETPPPRRFSQIRSLVPLKKKKSTRSWRIECRKQFTVCVCVHALMAKAGKYLMTPAMGVGTAFASLTDPFLAAPGAKALLRALHTKLHIQLDTAQLSCR